MASSEVTATTLFFFFSSRRRHTRLQGDWSSDVCSSDLQLGATPQTVLFVGDSGIDAACAQAAGVRLAAHLGGYAANPDDLRPYVVAFSDYAEFHSWMAARTSTQSTAETTHHV